uniref:Uncharacterized protein n=1 Tax=Candidatus Kentrum eta TaxID=2126337 RepID=A0A450W4B1_9GAMM|nr:MAG: hypothetical protein BECKH772A_GA0070896_105022 [Candidatus Kentron sp. H]VFK06918.1 MAG: hypothetical protein BECKH772B_GA0070898_107272 [Candidatus Kentron sp. H]VFK07127.1 MAG: hypothetical protein BECKH772A_GA0070896_107002 [Candidatus Kentron sp. H]VFK07277.1 MAG: hypothetical protein BECKH772B_GA0070898_107601 [Candidatus Kentron sp. H]VFK11785.1 MAG: hypothetical protein BECKH772C_GA0070978_108741 [Candidatus Kentron sp. H]
MEDVSEVYKRPYNPGETPRPIPMESGQPQPYDYEYEPLGTAVNFMVTEPLAGWRKVNVRDTRTAVDLAWEIYFERVTCLISKAVERSDGIGNYA